MFLDFEEVLDRYTLLDAADLLEIKLTKESETVYRGKCPKCSNDRTLRVTLNIGPKNRGWAGCHSCGSKGLDAIKLVKWIKGFEKMPEAAQWLLDQGKRNDTVDTVATVPNAAIEQSDTPADERQAKLAGVVARLVFEHDQVQALGLSPETAKARSIGWVKTGTMANRVLLPLFINGQLTDFAGYNPALDPVLKLPAHLTEAKTSADVIPLKAKR